MNSKALLPLTFAALSAVPSHAALVAYVPLDSTAGLTAGTPDTGTNDATITSAGAKFGSAASLDGASDFFVVDAGSGISGTGARTVSVWVNQTAGTVNLRTPVTLGNNGNGTKFDLDIDNASDGIEVGVGAGRTTTSGVGFASGAWQLLTVTAEAGQTVGNVLAYLNGGSPITSTANARAIDTSSTRLLVGASANVATVSGNPSAQFFNGLVDDVAIWDEALTQNEIKGLHDVGNSNDLAYTANFFDQLKQVHDAAGGSTTIGSLEWSYATGLGATAGLSGSGTEFTLVLDGAGGTGLVSTLVPEPGIALLGGLGLLGLLGRRRR